MAGSNAHRLRGLFNRILSLLPPTTILPKETIFRGDRTDRIHSFFFRFGGLAEKKMARPPFPSQQHFLYVRVKSIY